MISRYDKNMVYIGPVDKKDAHIKGYWHKVATGIVYNPAKKPFSFKQFIQKITMALTDQII